MNCRTPIAILLSWLGLPLCGQSTEASIATALQNLDAALNNGDIASYLATFEADHAGAHALLAHRLQRLLPQTTSNVVLRRKSSILGIREVGPRTVVRVRYELFVDDKPIAAELEDSIVAFRASGSRMIPTFAIDTPRQVACKAADLFQCPPCNYEIGGVPGWLCVPVGRDRAQALEASSFYLMGTDLACDVSVRIDDRRRDPIQLVEQLATALRSVEPTAVSKLATAWLPPGCDPEQMPGLSGARLEIEVPGSAADKGSVALFHAVQFGDLQHLLLLRGSRETLRQHAGAVERLLASFRLVDTNAERAAAGARALRFHAGGTVDGSTYDNAKYGVHLTGPAEWKAQQRCGGAAFRVVWSSASGARLWLTGYSVPPGMSFWCNQTVEQWLNQLCKATGIDLPDRLDDWQHDPTCAARARTIHCSVPRDTSAGELPGRDKRVLRIAFRDDLLIVVDGAAVTDEDWRSIHAAFATLRL